MMDVARRVSGKARWHVRYIRIHERNIMKIIQTLAVTALVLASQSARAGQPIINLSIGGEITPGVYGQVQFGNAPPPPVVYAQPMVISPPPPNVVVTPIYLHVPPRHAKHWAKYCRRYNACNRPVYFVKSREYEPGFDMRKEMQRRKAMEHHKEEHREKRDHDRERMD